MEQDKEGKEGVVPRSRRPIWLGAAAILVLIGLLAAALQIRSIFAPAPPRPTPVADVSSERLLALGSVLGFAAAHDTHAWVGLPFAQPPVDALRWRAPRPPAAWGDTRDALTVGAPCLQLASKLGGVPAEDESGFAGQEDCLYLNVWAPRREVDAVPTGAARWPVMVFVHGGGNNVGFGGSAMYDGAQLAGRENVIVVTFNYRLGPLGWLSHPALRAEAENGLEASGNFGLLDQIRALEWVAAHIEEFGGDPGNVTIFGESAGGLDVYALMLADAANGLFDRAIVQSGALSSASRNEAENGASALPPGATSKGLGSGEAVVELLVSAGVVPDREAAKGYADALSPADLLDWLRGRPGREILDVYRSTPDPQRLALPKPIRDGVLLPTEPWLERFRAGRFNVVPLIAGINRDEEKLYLSQDLDHVDRRFGVLYRVRDEEDFERRARALSDFWAVRGVVEPANAIVASGHRDVFAYRFEWDELPALLGTDLSRLIGAAHGLELPLLFGTFDVGDPFFSRVLYADVGRESRERLSLAMMSYWAEFARSGNPGRGGQGDQPQWLSWSEDVGPDEVPPKTTAEAPGRFLHLDSPDAGGLRMGYTPLSREALVTAIDSAEGLDQDAKCELFEAVFHEEEGWSDAAFIRIGRDGCRGVPRRYPKD